MVHICFQIFVDPFFVGNREVTQMDAFRSIFIDASYQVLVDIFGHERNHRSSNFGDGYQGSIQCHIGIDLILFHSFCPETFTASSYIPVTHIIYEFLQCSCCFRDPVVVQVVVYGLDHGIQFGQQPFVHNRQFIIIQGVFCCIKFINVCIEYKERIGVPQSTHEFSLTFLYRFSMETVRQPRCAVDIEVPADRICSVCLQCIERIYRISFGLTHLLTVFILYMTQYDNVLVRSLVE